MLRIFLTDDALSAKVPQLTLRIAEGDCIVKFQFVEQNSVECWCDLGANLVQHFIKRYSRYSRYRTKTHDKCTISHVFPRCSRYQTVLLKLKEIISTFGRNLQKMLCLYRAFFVISWRTMNCPYGHELA